MEDPLIALAILVLGVPIILFLRDIARSLRLKAETARPGLAKEAPTKIVPAPPAAKAVGDEDDEDFPVIAQLKKRGFICRIVGEAPPGRACVGDLVFEPSSDFDDPDAPKLFCPTCANPMFDFAEALEGGKGEEGPRWCEYGSVCLCCGFYFEDEESGYRGFFGPLIEECYDFNEIFEILDEKDGPDRRKLLARREAEALRQLLTFRSQRKALEREPPKEKPGIVLTLVPPPRSKSDDP